MWSKDKFCSVENNYYSYDEGFQVWYYDYVSIAQTGTSAQGALVELTRSLRVLNANMFDSAITFTCEGQSVKSAVLTGLRTSGTQETKTSSVTMYLPSAWAGKTVSWSMDAYAGETGRSGTFVFDGYGQFALSINTTAHITATVTRTSSPKANASKGTLTSGDAIYTGDVISISYAADTGYSAVVTANGQTVASGSSLTVSAGIVLSAAAEPKATADIFANGAWSKHLIYIYSGGEWSLYQAEIYSGGAWSKYF